MKDYQLYLVVATFVLIDVITMTAWQILDPFFRETKDLLPQVIKELTAASFGRSYTNA